MSQLTEIVSDELWELFPGVHQYFRWEKSIHSLGLFQRAEN